MESKRLNLADFRRKKKFELTIEKKKIDDNLMEEEATKQIFAICSEAEKAIRELRDFIGIRRNTI
jgi:hypothetical protein